MHTFGWSKINFQRTLRSGKTSGNRVCDHCFVLLNWQEFNHFAMVSLFTNRLKVNRFKYFWHNILMLRHWRWVWHGFQFNVHRVKIWKEPVTYGIRTCLRHMLEYKWNFEFLNLLKCWIIFYMVFYDSNLFGYFCDKMLCRLNKKIRYIEDLLQTVYSFSYVVNKTYDQ